MFRSRKTACWPWALIRAHRIPGQSCVPQALASHRAAWQCSRCRPGSLSDPSQIEEQVSVCIRRCEQDWLIFSRRRQWGLLATMFRRLPRVFSWRIILPLNEIFDVASLISYGDYALNLINTNNNGLLLGSLLMIKATIRNDAQRPGWCFARLDILLKSGF